MVGDVEAGHAITIGGMALVLLEFLPGEPANTLVDTAFPADGVLVQVCWTCRHYVLKMHLLEPSLVSN